ncbi:PLDc N-terminal domain-containing protein [Desulfobotulus sp. H1]|uniref:PLDc N-terminal domain-containing protein n=1 Tax=Desulfobotulus pelophilus TaxID=2823377 RepID=A0ABT3NBW1_9BACT|nr:PLDc N-terminal domain-containing protein [Desulfobotulus pelophilus]MCW7754944.1 PLDc N-terminal domain-containing protein [Desulfobotulus pelophilus]
METVLVWVGLGFLFLILTNLAFFDVLRRDFGSKGKKALWGIIALIPFIGCILYVTIGMRLGRRLPPETTT